MKLGSKAARPSEAAEAGVASRARMTNEIRNVAKICRSTRLAQGSHNFNTEMGSAKPNPETVKIGFAPP